MSFIVLKWPNNEIEALKKINGFFIVETNIL